MADGFERYHGGAERNEELEKAAAERSAELDAKRSAERHEHKEAAEKALAEARAEAQMEAKSAHETKVGDKNERERSDHDITGSAGRLGSYKQTMTTIRRQMPMPARVFSKFIHAKTVERVSDAVGATIARPDAILSGAVFAFVLVLALYLHARYNGYALSGSETIVAFVAGWLAGILFDLARKALKRRR